MKQPKELARFIESEVIRQYGAEKYLLRLFITLRDTQLEDRALSTILSVQQTVLSNKAFGPYFVTTGVLGALCDILERENNREVPEPGIVSSIAESTVDIFGWITEEVPLAEGAAILIREHNIFHLIARYILHLSKTLTARGLDYVLEFCRANEHLGQRLAARSGKNALRKDYQRALRQEWAPLLIAPDNLHTLNHPDGVRIIKLVRQAWWRLGSVGAGFNEEKEKKEYEKRAEKMCSWRECCWHTIEPPSPTKLCQGCGEARYCGSPCQRRDWKGGHERACRRLKNTSHHGPVP
ncbi:hypothetical protein PENSPDRAFT_646971 [Peniophora sp. CONT]|nr:hypothetical protein PENSPDRAFT_646971 [Peniophora sp. CONT]